MDGGVDGGVAVQEVGMFQWVRVVVVGCTVPVAQKSKEQQLWWWCSCSCLTEEVYRFHRCCDEILLDDGLMVVLVLGVVRVLRSRIGRTVALLLVLRPAVSWQSLSSSAAAVAGGGAGGGAGVQLLSVAALTLFCFLGLWNCVLLTRRVVAGSNSNNI